VPWIDDVVTHTTITSVWGNKIRNRVVHQFTTKAERDGAGVVPVEGMVCHVADVNIVYVRTDGAWWVLAMPWRSYTASVWTIYSSTLTAAQVLQTFHARWRQTMGSCQALLWAQCHPVTDNVDLNVVFTLPVASIRNGDLGQARLYSNHNAVVNGGRAVLYDAARAIVGNVGVDVAPNARHFALSGNSNFDVHADVAYECDPTVDTP
jgi:hypothetical protein